MNGFFGLFVFGDVGKGGNVVGDLVIRIANRGNAEPLRIDFPVFAPIPYFALPVAVLFQGMLQYAIKVDILAPRVKHCMGFANDFFRAIAGDAGKCLVDLQNSLIGIGNGHAFLRFKGGCGDAKLCLGLFLLGNVAKTPHPADYFVVDYLGDGISLDDFSILEFNNIERIGFRGCIQSGYFIGESFGVFYLIGAV